MGKAAKILIPGDWRAREYQLPLWRYLRNGGKRATAVWHRRSGKDEVALYWTMLAITQRAANYWHLLPQQTQARKAVWDAVNSHSGKRRIDEAFPVELRETTRENEMTVRFRNGAMWHVVGSDNFNSLVGSPPAGVVFSEWALSDPAAWGYLRPILAENDGWALFITTPRGNNHAKTMLDAARADPAWFSEVLPATATGVFSPAQLELERREYMAQFGVDQGRALYEQEYLCSFEAAVLGAFYAAELSRAREEKRIGIVPIDRMVPVHTAWDLGYTDSTAIWFVQVVGREVRLVDYHEEGGAGLDHYASVLDEKRREHHWRYADGSNGVSHWFPHDVEHHELATGQSRAATLRSLGITPTVVPVAHVMDGINATRRLLSRAWIDEKRCARGINALQAYRREWDEVAKVFKAKPLHDWSSHGCLTGETLVRMVGGDKRIDAVTVGDIVWTPAGPALVTAAGLVKQTSELVEIATPHGVLQCTPEHKIATARGFVRADALRSFDRILSGEEPQWRMISWCSKVANTGLRVLITGPGIGARPRDRPAFIEQCGKTLTALFRRAMRSITKTAMEPIAISPTLSFSPSPSINGCMPWNGSPTALYDLQRPMLSLERQSGTHLTKDWSGIGNTASKHGKAASGWRAFARSVGRNFARLSLRVPNTATLIASRRLTVADAVSVYDLTIEKHGCYQANGLLVSNSDALRTFAMGFGDDSAPKRDLAYKRRPRRGEETWMSA